MPARGSPRPEPMARQESAVALRAFRAELLARVAERRASSPRQSDGRASWEYRTARRNERRARAPRRRNRSTSAILSRYVGTPRRLAPGRAHRIRHGRSRQAPLPHRGMPSNGFPASRWCMAAFRPRRSPTLTARGITSNRRFRPIIDKYGLMRYATLVGESVWPRGICRQAARRATPTPSDETSLTNADSESDAYGSITRVNAGARLT